MKRETTMAFLAGVTVTGAFFAGMGMQKQSGPRIVAASDDCRRLLLDTGEILTLRSRGRDIRGTNAQGNTYVTKEVMAEWWESDGPPIGKMLDPRIGAMKDHPTTPTR